MDACLARARRRYTVLEAFTREVGVHYRAWMEARSPGLRFMSMMGLP